MALVGQKPATASARVPPSNKPRPKLSTLNVKTRNLESANEMELNVRLDRQGNLHMHDCVVSANGLDAGLCSRLASDLRRSSSFGGSSAHSESNSSTEASPCRQSVSDHCENRTPASICMQDFPELQNAGLTADGKPIKCYQLVPREAARKATMDTTSDSRESLTSYACSPPRWKDFKTVSRRSLGDGATSTVHIVNYVGPLSCDPEHAGSSHASPSDGNQKQKLYADKVIKISRPEVAQCIYRELCIIKDDSITKNCKHIVQSFQAFFVEDEIHIIMEFMNLGSLTDVLRKTPHHTLLGPPLYSVLYQVLLAVKALHSPDELGLHGPCIHRDIKPSNILLSKKGWVKLADFGCVKITCAGSTVDANTFVGTRTFMSPERLTGGSYDTPSDIWSIGVVAYLCAFGRHPFRPENEASLVSLLHVMESEVLIVGHCDPLLKDFIVSCLAIDPHVRHTASDLLAHPLFAKIKEDPQKVVRKWRKSMAAHEEEK
jgi:tRNA A-37 threonylcarbamoyl transferase component Bud32